MPCIVDRRIVKGRMSRAQLDVQKRKANNKPAMKRVLALVNFAALGGSGILTLF